MPRQAFSNSLPKVPGKCFLIACCMIWLRAHIRTLLLPPFPHLLHPDFLVFGVFSLNAFVSCCLYPCSAMHVAKDMGRSVPIMQQPRVKLMVALSLLFCQTGIAALESGTTRLEDANLQVHEPPSYGCDEPIQSYGYALPPSYDSDSPSWSCPASTTPKHCKSSVIWKIGV